MKILVIDEKLTAKEIEDMVLVMFKQNYAQVKVSMEGSVGRQFLLYKRLIDVGDIDMDINEEETENSFNELISFIRNTVDTYNKEHKSKLIIDEENIRSRYKKNSQALQVKIIIRDANNSFQEATHFDIELKIVKEVVTIATVKDIEIKGKPLEGHIFSKLVVLSNVDKYQGRVGKDLKALNDMLRDCGETGINADRIVDLMKTNFYPKGKYKELTSRRVYNELKRLYNSERPAENVDIAFKRIFDFLKPLLNFEGQKYDRWDSKLGWIKKDNK